MTRTEAGRMTLDYWQPERHVGIHRFVLRLFGWKLGLGFWTGRPRYFRVTVQDDRVRRVWCWPPWFVWWPLLSESSGSRMVHVDFARRLTVAVKQEAGRVRV